MENEEKKEEQVEQNVQNEGFEDLSNEQGSIKSDVEKNAMGNTKKSIISELESLKITDTLKQIKLDEFVKEKGLQGINSEQDIPDELKSEFADYQLDSSNPEVASLFEKAKKAAIDIANARQYKINELYGYTKDVGRIQMLKDNIAKKKAEIEESLKTAKPEEKKKYEEQLKRLEEMDKEVGDKEQNTGIFKDVSEIKKQQDVVGAVVYEKLNTRFAPYVSDAHEMIYNDESLKKALGEYDEKTKSVNKVLDNINKEDIDKDEKSQENPEQQKEGKNVAPQQAKGATIPPEIASKLAQQMAGQQAPGAVAVGDDIEPEMDLQPDYLALLGYNADNALNFENASELLDKFANGPTDKTRLEMLNDPECKKVILKALAVTGSNLNPKKAKMFNATRDKILGLSKGPMMEMALRDMGIENPENVKKEFNALNKEYNSSRAELEQKLKNNPDNKEEIQAQINELDEKYKSIKNVDDFQKSSKKIRTIRSTFREFKDAILNKNSYKALAEKAQSVVRGEDNKDVKENTNDAPSFMDHSLVNNKEDVAKKEAEKIKTEQLEGPDMKFSQAYEEKNKNDQGQQR